MDIVTFGRLRRAVLDVREEMTRHGFFDQRLALVKVRLVPFGVAFGWCHYGETGDIYVPVFSLSKIWDFVGGSWYSSLRDLLRHEYAHSLAHTHRGLFCSVPFKRAFGAHHDADVISTYDPSRHVTRYAASSPCEDFAEIFMLYLRHDGELPVQFNSWVIRRKWTFTASLGCAVANGHRTWRTACRA